MRENTKQGEHKMHALYSEDELRLQALVVLVGWQVKSIETSMAPRESVRVSTALNRKPSGSEKKK
jgi:hypothetical protein